MTVAQTGSSPSASNAMVSTDEAIRTVATQRVYFGHQSVGGNLMSGLESVVAGKNGIKVVKTEDPASVSGPAIVHFNAGTNEDPASKNAEFLRVLDSRPARDGGIAMLKYCYIDVNPGTDIAAVFDGYRRTIAQVREKHPDLTVVHVTMPLTTDASGPKATIKRMLGRVTSREVNLKRNQFNSMLRKEFSSEPIFDLAALESTRPDGSREQSSVGGETVYALTPNYTDDGGHLLPDAQRRFAEQFLKLLATVPAGKTNPTVSGASR